MVKQVNNNKQLDKLNKSIFDKRRGATSVLVVLMLVVLVALGSFAITSARVNIKFSNQAIDWNTMYYDMDSMGENYIMEIDTRLSRAEEQAVDYILNKGYEALTHRVLPIAIHSDIHYGFNQGGGDMNARLNDALNLVYFYFAEKELADLETAYPESVTAILKDGDVASAIATDINFTYPENIRVHLNVTVSVKPLAYTFENWDGEITGIRSNNLRYQVDSWKEWQNTSDLGDGISVWDGEFIIIDE